MRFFINILLETIKKLNRKRDNMKKDIDENIFDEEFFAEVNGPTPEKSTSVNKHLIFFGVVILLLLFAIIRLVIWNKGIDSGFDPTEDTSEFDTEPLDYIQPLNSTQLEGKPDDGVTTIFCFGNSPFADDGDENALAREIATAYDAQIVNAAFEDSFQAPSSEEYNEDSPEESLSLLPVTKALVTKDFSLLEKAAIETSEEAVEKVNYLKTVDIASADMMVIMYDLNDYLEHRSVLDPNYTSNPVTFAGALESSIQLIQKNYPYIRIVVLSIPASGKTIDNYYVDGDVIDLGNGTLVDYLGHEANICISNGVSFIDTYFGVINIDNRDQYLADEYHLNEDGAKAIAARMKELIVLSN